MNVGWEDGEQQSDQTPASRYSRGAKANSEASQDFRNATYCDHCFRPGNVGRHDREAGRRREEMSRARDNEKHRERESRKNAHRRDSIDCRRRSGEMSRGQVEVKVAAAAD